MTEEHTCFEYVDDYFELSQKYYEDEELLQAIDTLKTAESRLLSGEISFKDETVGQTDYDRFAKSKLVTSLYKDNDLIFQCLETYKKIIRKNPERSSDGIDNWFIQDEKLSSLTICGRVTISTSFFNMIAVFKEVDILKESVSSFEELCAVKIVSQTRWLAMNRVKMPITISNRELYIVGFGIFLKKENMIMILLHSPDSDDEEYKECVPPENSKYARLQMNYGFYCVKYLDHQTSELFSCFNIDPKVSYVPWFVLNGVIKEFGYYYMNDLRKAAENEKLAAKYKQRMIEYSSFYNLVRKKLGIKEDIYN